MGTSSKRVEGSPSCCQIASYVRSEAVSRQIMPLVSRTEKSNECARAMRATRCPPTRSATGCASSGGDGVYCSQQCRPSPIYVADRTDTTLIRAYLAYTR